MRKFFVLAFALAVAALAGAVAGEAQQPIVINLLITSVAGLPVASVGFPVQNQDFKLVDKPGDFTAEADDDHGAAFGNVTVRASPSPFCLSLQRRSPLTVTLMSTLDLYN